MTVAGFGFTTTTTLAALREALALAGGPQGVSALATAKAKAANPCLRALAAELNLPLLAIPPAHLQAQTTLTQSARARAHYGAGSVAEAAALAAAGPGACLLGPRVTSSDGSATAAIATTAPPERPHP